MALTPILKYFALLHDNNDGIYYNYYTYYFPPHSK